MTTYIESKLNPDGTYDHSELIEAHEKGAKIRRFDDYGYDIPSDKPAWWPTSKYRAVIEDKTFIKQWSDVIKNMPQHPGIRDLVALEQLVFDKFQSGNAIPVERITLTRAEVNEVFPGLLK